jgi:hypothetical protein
MANLRAWRGTAAGPTSLPQLQFKALLGQHIVVPMGATSDYGTVLPEGMKLVFDFACFWEGEVCYQPKFDDTRMVLRGTELPAFSGDEGYTGGIKLHVAVQRIGLCSFLSTSEAVIRAIDVLYDAYIFAPEAQAGQLPVYEIGEPRSYHARYRPEPLYAPVYVFIGWTPRGSLFGPPLIPPPKPQLISTEIIPGPTAETDELFSQVQHRGEVTPPAPAALPDNAKGKRRTKRKPAGAPGAQWDVSLDDGLPF